MLSFAAPWLLAAVLAPCPAIAPQEGDGEDEGSWMEGHSFHGSAFNEGPRQAAILMGNGVSTNFPITTDVPMAQVMFNQGVCQLHGFWFLEAERSFRQVAAMDPDCAMAYWGMTMATKEDEDVRSAGFAREAWLRRDQASEREQQYIDMWAGYHDVKYPAFDGKPLADDKKDKKGKGDKDIGEDTKNSKDEAQKEGDAKDADAKDADSAEAKAEPAVLEPGTPEYDTALRAYEDKKFAERKPAEDKDRFGRIVKDYEKLVYDYPEDIEAKAFLANRLWFNGYRGHPITSRMANQALLDQVFAVNPMHPAHHYRIHLWDTKEEAYRVVDSAARNGQTAPGIAHMWHMSGHIFSRLERYHDAAWQQEASSRVDHAQMVRYRVMPDQIHNYAHNQEWMCRNLQHIGRVRDALDIARNLVELPRHPRYNTLNARGSANYGRQRLFQVLETFELWDELIATCNTMYLEPSEESGDEAMRSSLLGRAFVEKGDLARAREQIDRLEELLVLARSERATKVDEAEVKAKADGKKEDEIQAAMAAAMKAESRGVRGIETDIAVLGALVNLAEQTEVEASLKVLADNRFDKLALSRLHLQADDSKQAKKLAQEATKNANQQATPWANLAWVLYRSEGAEAAREAFDTLRAFSSRFDLDAPPFARLAALASELGHPADWRTPHVIAADTGKRPDLDTLGPFRWSPPAALDWTLEDPKGGLAQMADYEGRPVLLIFFLGFGCVHCVEQLQAFGPEAERFKKLGIDIVAIGTDTLAELRSSLESDPDAYPFRILADPDLDVFKQWRCHDDFESQPLHGTFLVDADGDVRWQDISYEPFIDTEFLLEESERLLGLPKPGAILAGSAEAEAAAASGGGLRP